MMAFTVGEVLNAELVLVATASGDYKWSSDRSDQEVAEFLRGVADQIEER